MPVEMLWDWQAQSRPGDALTEQLGDRYCIFLDAEDTVRGVWSAIYALYADLWLASVLPGRSRVG